MLIQHNKRSWQRRECMLRFKSTGPNIDFWSTTHRGLGSCCLWPQAHHDSCLWGLTSCCKRGRTLWHLCSKSPSDVGLAPERCRWSCLGFQEVLMQMLQNSIASSTTAAPVLLLVSVQQHRPGALWCSNCTWLSALGMDLMLSWFIKGVKWYSSKRAPLFGLVLSAFGKAESTKLSAFFWAPVVCISIASLLENDVCAGVYLCRKGLVNIPALSVSVAFFKTYTFQKCQSLTL